MPRVGAIGSLYERERSPGRRPARLVATGTPFAMKRGRVTIEQIRKAYDARPFVPFLLHLADGREIPVRSREFMGRAPGRTVAVYHPDGRRNVIDLLLVTDLEFES